MRDLIILLNLILLMGLFILAKRYLVFLNRPPQISFYINAPITTYFRGFLYEDPLYNWLVENGGGPIGGDGGTYDNCGQLGAYFSFDLQSSKQIEGALNFMESLVFPEGSYCKINNRRAKDVGNAKSVSVGFRVKEFLDDDLIQVKKLFSEALDESKHIVLLRSDSLLIYSRDLVLLQAKYEEVKKIFPDLELR